VLSPDRLLELLGMASGLACVWLLIRQNVLTFPIGAAYALISVAVMARNGLYADVLLNAYYVVVNVYGWWYWNVREEEQGAVLAVTRIPRTTLLLLIPVAIVAFLALFFVISSAQVPRELVAVADCQCPQRVDVFPARYLALLFSVCGLSGDGGARVSRLVEEHAGTSPTTTVIPRA